MLAFACFIVGAVAGFIIGARFGYMLEAAVRSIHEDR